MDDGFESNHRKRSHDQLRAAGTHQSARNNCDAVYSGQPMTVQHDDGYDAALYYQPQQQYRQFSPPWQILSPFGDACGVQLASPWVQAQAQGPDDGYGDYDYMESHRERQRRRCDQPTFPAGAASGLAQRGQQQRLPQAHRNSSSSSSRQPARAPGSAAASRAAAPAGLPAHTNCHLEAAGQQRTTPSPAAQQQAATRAAGATPAPVRSLGTDGQPRSRTALLQVLQGSCVERPGCLAAPTPHRHQAKPAAATEAAPLETPHSPSTVAAPHTAAETCTTAHSTAPAGNTPTAPTAQHNSLDPQLQQQPGSTVSPSVSPVVPPGSSPAGGTSSVKKAPGQQGTSGATAFIPRTVQLNRLNAAAAAAKKPEKPGPGTGKSSRQAGCGEQQHQPEHAAAGPATVPPAAAAAAATLQDPCAPIPPGPSVPDPDRQTSLDVGAGPAAAAAWAEGAALPAVDSSKPPAVLLHTAAGERDTRATTVAHPGAPLGQPCLGLQDPVLAVSTSDGVSISAALKTGPEPAVPAPPAAAAVAAGPLQPAVAGGSKQQGTGPIPGPRQQGLQLPAAAAAKASAVQLSRGEAAPPPAAAAAAAAATPQPAATVPAAVPSFSPRTQLLCCEGLSPPAANHQPLPGLRALQPAARLEAAGTRPAAVRHASPSSSEGQLAATAAAQDRAAAVKQEVASCYVKTEPAVFPHTQPTPPAAPAAAAPAPAAAAGVPGLDLAGLEQQLQQRLADPSHVRWHVVLLRNLANRLYGKPVEPVQLSALLPQLPGQLQYLRERVTGSDQLHHKARLQPSIAAQHTSCLLRVLALPEVQAQLHSQEQLQQLVQEVTQAQQQFEGLCGSSAGAAPGEQQQGWTQPPASAAAEAAVCGGQLPAASQAGGPAQFFCDEPTFTVHTAVALSAGTLASAGAMAQSHDQHGTAANGRLLPVLKTVSGFTLEQHEEAAAGQLLQQAAAEAEAADDVAATAPAAAARETPADAAAAAATGAFWAHPAADGAYTAAAANEPAMDHHASQAPHLSIADFAKQQPRAAIPFRALAKQLYGPLYDPAAVQVHQVVRQRSVLQQCLLQRTAGLVPNEPTLSASSARDYATGMLCALHQPEVKAQLDQQELQQLLQQIAADRRAWCRAANRAAAGNHRYSAAAVVSGRLVVQETSAPSDDQHAGGTGQADLLGQSIHLDDAAGGRRGLAAATATGSISAAVAAGGVAMQAGPRARQQLKQADPRHQQQQRQDAGQYPPQLPPQLLSEIKLELTQLVTEQFDPALPQLSPAAPKQPPAKAGGTTQAGTQQTSAAAAAAAAAAPRGQAGVGSATQAVGPAGQDSAASQPPALSVADVCALIPQKYDSGCWLLRVWAKLVFGDATKPDAVQLAQLAPHWGVFEQYLDDRVAGRVAGQEILPHCTVRLYVRAIQRVFDRPAVLQQLHTCGLQQLTQRVAATKARWAGAGGAGAKQHSAAAAAAAAAATNHQQRAAAAAAAADMWDDETDASWDEDTSDSDSRSYSDSGSDNGSDSDSGSDNGSDSDSGSDNGSDSDSGSDNGSGSGNDNGSDSDRCDDAATGALSLAELLSTVSRQAARLLDEWARLVFGDAYSPARVPVAKLVQQWDAFDQHLQQCAAGSSTSGAAHAASTLRAAQQMEQVFERPDIQQQLRPQDLQRLRQGLAASKERALSDSGPALEATGHEMNHAGPAQAAVAAHQPAEAAEDAAAETASAAAAAAAEPGPCRAPLCLSVLYRLSEQFGRNAPWLLRTWAKLVFGDPADSRHVSELLPHWDVMDAHMQQRMAGSIAGEGPLVKKTALSYMRCMQNVFEAPEVQQRLSSQEVQQINQQILRTRARWSKRAQAELQHNKGMLHSISSPFGAAAAAAASGIPNLPPGSEAAARPGAAAAAAASGCCQWLLPAAAAAAASQSAVQLPAQQQQHAAGTAVEGDAATAAQLPTADGAPDPQPQSPMTLAELISSASNNKVPGQLRQWARLVFGQDVDTDRVRVSELLQHWSVYDMYLQQKLAWGPDGSPPAVKQETAQHYTYGLSSTLRLQEVQAQISSQLQQQLAQQIEVTKHKLRGRSCTTLQAGAAAVATAGQADGNACVIDATGDTSSDSMEGAAAEPAAGPGGDAMDSAMQPQPQATQRPSGLPQPTRQYGRPPRHAHPMATSTSGYSADWCCADAVTTGQQAGRHSSQVPKASMQAGSGNTQQQQLQAAAAAVAAAAAPAVDEAVSGAAAAALTGCLGTSAAPLAAGPLELHPAAGSDPAMQGHLVNMSEATGLQATRAAHEPPAAALAAREGAACGSAVTQAAVTTAAAMEVEGSVSRLQAVQDLQQEVPPASAAGSAATQGFAPAQTPPPAAAAEAAGAASTTEAVAAAGTVAAGATDEFITTEARLLELYLQPTTAWAEAQKLRQALAVLRELPAGDTRVKRFYTDWMWVQYTAQHAPADDPSALPGAVSALIQNALK